MADIKVRIEVNPNAESELLGDVKNVMGELSNVSLKTNSSSIFQNIPTSESNGTNGLSLAQDLVFDSQGYLDNEDLQGAVIESEQNPTEFVWGVVPPSKAYSVKLTFTNAENLKDIIVYGNKTTNQFPTRAIIDGKTEIFSDDYRWAINLETESDTHTIEFTHWNRADYNASLTFIAVMMKYLEINKRSGLKSVESLSQSTGQPKEIFYGVIPSSGSLEIIDINGEIADMIRDEIIPNSNLNIELFANNKKVQIHTSSDSDYSSDAIFYVNMANKLNNLDKINYKGFKNENVSKTLYDILIDALADIGYKDTNYIDNVMLGEENATYLKSIIYPSPYVPVMNFKDFIDKVCEIAQFTLTQNDNGDLVFINLKPVNVISNYILIPQRMQVSSPFKTVVLNNKIERVEYVNSNFKKDINKTVNTYTNDKVFVEPFDNYDRTVPITNMRYYYTSGQSAGQTLTQAVRVETFVSTGSFEIVDQSIETIQNFEFTLNGKVYNNPTFFGNNISESYWSRADSSLLSNSNVTFDEDSYTSFSEQLKDVSITFNRLEDFETTTLKLEHNNTITFSKVADGKWIANYSILTSTAKYYQYTTNIYTTEKSGELRTAETLTISANGTQWTIDFVDNVVKVGDLESSLYKSLNKNELLQDNATYNGSNIGTIISNNILNMYNKGLSTAELSVICGDYYDNSRQLAKKWSNGEILQVGDIVRIDKDNLGNALWKYSNGSDMYFRITGRTFKYTGVPLIDLQLQEVKVV